jgi:predicted nucleic acid-binding protein
LIVIDASAGIDWLLQTPNGDRIDRYISVHTGSLNAPHLIDIEVAHSLRRLVRLGLISPLRGDQAISFLQALPISRHPHTDLLPRIWRHRHILSAYDATYVALAEMLGATLITRDARLASAHGHTAKIQLF